MPPASSSLRTGWITVWIALGVIALVLFVALPIAVTRRATAEFARYQACLESNRNQDCRPSIVWYMNGWTLEATSSTVSTPLAPAPAN